MWNSLRIKGYIYCNSGKRTRIALEKLRKLGIEAEPLHNPDSYEKQGKKIICAVNYVEIRPGEEKKFEELASSICSEAENLVRISGFEIYESFRDFCKGQRV